MVASTMTLSDYVRVGERDLVRVLVEHDRCGQSLGEHVVTADDFGLVIGKKPFGTDRRSKDGVSLLPANLGPETTPGLRSSERFFNDQPYVRCYCVCLPAGHVEKLKLSKLGQLPVTFPEWKWGRPVDLPVVTF